MAGGAGMTGLDEAVRDYLTIRRALGFKLVEHQRLLPQFAAFLEQTGADTITTELAVEWPAVPAGRRAGKRNGSRSRAGSRSTCGRSTPRRRSRPRASCVGGD
jgi:hypothetical protein